MILSICPLGNYNPWCSLTLPCWWCDNLQQTVTELYHVLKPVVTVIFVPLKTLCHFADTWLQIDTEQRVNDFLSLDAWQNSLQACGLKPLSCIVKKIEYFTTVRDLMHSIKAVGANVKKAGVIKHTGKSQLQQLYRAYEIYQPVKGTSLPLGTLFTAL